MEKVEPKVELRRLVGKFCEPATGKIRTAGWEMDQLLLNGRQISTINRVPGAPVGLMAGIQLTPSERKAVEDAIAAQRGGVKPASIGGPRKELYELLDDDDSEGDDE